MDWIPYVEIRDKETREIIGIIEGAELEFNYAFHESGEFEVYCRATDNNLELLKKDNYVTLPVSINGTREEIETNSNMWVIQKIQKTNDATGGRWISATGKEAKQIVDKRIIRNTAKLDKGADISSEVRTKLFTPNLLTPADTRRPIKGFNFTENTVGVPITDDTQVTYENLFAYTEELYKTYGVGARLRLDRNTNEMIYTIYKGNDRSEEIVFSQGNDNLLNSDYVEDWAEYRTSALVGGEEKEEIETDPDTGITTRRYTTRTMIVVEDGSEDINRSEVFVDAKDLQSSYNEDVNGVSVERTYTPTVYKAMLQARGKEKLTSENNVVREFNGEIDTVNNQYKFNIDFYLGDEIKIRDEDLGEERTVRVSKFTKVQNNEGYKEYFEYEEISTLSYLEPEEVEGALLTEGEENLLTENNEVLLVEEVPTTYSTTSTSTGGVKISELPEATNINEDCCLPIVSEYETKRITYGGLKERLNEDLNTPNIDTSNFVTTNTEQTITAKKTIANSAEMLNEDGHNILKVTDVDVHINNILKELRLYSNGRPYVHDGQQQQMAYLSDIPTKISDLINDSYEIVYDTNTASTGTKTFLTDISKFKALCFVYYNNNSEYSCMTVPMETFKVSSASHKIFLNSSSASNTRYMLLYYVSDTSFYISGRSSTTDTAVALRRVYGVL